MFCSCVDLIDSRRAWQDARLRGGDHGNATRQQLQLVADDLRRQVNFAIACFAINILMTSRIGNPSLTRSEPGCAGKHCGQRRSYCVVNK